MPARKLTAGELETVDSVYSAASKLAAKHNDWHFQRELRDIRRWLAEYRRAWQKGRRLPVPYYYPVTPSLRALDREFYYFGYRVVAGDPPTVERME